LLVSQEKLSQQYLCIFVYYSSVRKDVQPGHNKEIYSEHIKEVEMKSEKQIQQMKELNEHIQIKIAELEANFQTKDRIIENLKLDTKK